VYFNVAHLQNFLEHICQSLDSQLLTRKPCYCNENRAMPV